MLPRRDDRVNSPRRRFAWRSFAHAWRGLRVLVATQPNAGVHLGAATAVLVLAVWTGCSTTEWALLVSAVVGVWVAEGLNTAVEFLVDLVSPEHHRLAGWAKDVAAGAVLLASIGAVVIGGLIFIPKLLRWWHG